MMEFESKNVYVRSQYELDAARFAHRGDPQITIVIMSSPDTWLGVNDPFAGSFELRRDSRVEVFAPNRVSVYDNARVAADDTVTVFDYTRSAFFSTAEPEIWLPVPGYEGKYSVSSFGRVRRDQWFAANGLIKPERILKQSYTPQGYAQLTLSEGSSRVTKNVHRIVCEAFHGPAPEGKPFVLHDDGNSRNNHEDNLVWGSRLQEYCKNGHEFTDENTYVYGVSGKRKCRECDSIRRNMKRGTKNAAAVKGVF